MNNRLIDYLDSLKRGDMDVEGVRDGLRADLDRGQIDAQEMMQGLRQAHEDQALTTSDYTVLTQFVADHTVHGEEQPSTGTGSDPDDPSMTRLATHLVSDSTGDTADTTVDVGARLRDRFILDEVLGIGGMGTVYRGRDMLKVEAQDRNPFVAVKVLNDSFKKRPDAFIALQREASRQQRLAHPNIATVYDFDRSKGVMFITMEYLDGHTLDAFIKGEVRDRGGLPLHEVMPILKDICAALDYAHARGIVHADFKPGNCFITQTHNVKVLDFGIARAMKDPNAEARDETLFDPRSIGALTPAYASPEMLLNSADADPRDDVYALACVTYELLTGKHPFHRVPADQAMQENSTMKRVKHLSRRQNEALIRALSFKREDRTASAKEFLDDLTGTSVLPSWPLIAGAAAVFVLLVAILTIPSLLDRRAADAVLAQLESGTGEDIEQGLAALVDLTPEHQTRVRQAARGPLLQYFRDSFDLAINQPDFDVDYPGLEKMVDRASQLFPDSAILDTLSQEFDQRYAQHLSELAEQFEDSLAPEHLVPDDNRLDLHDVIHRLTTIDPGNPLLVDARIGSAYAAAIDASITAEDYDNARLLVDAGLELAPDDPRLVDQLAQVSAIEQEIARLGRISDLESQLRDQVNAVTTVSMLPELDATIAELGSLAAESNAVTEAGQVLAERLQGEIDAVANAPTLPMVREFVDQYGARWATLGQTEVLTTLENRAAELRLEQDRLAEEISAAVLSYPVQTSTGDDVGELITALRRIDPADNRADLLLDEAINRHLLQASDLTAQARWDEARVALNEALALAPADAADKVRQQLSNVDSAEQAALAAAERNQRLAEEQRQQELLAAEAARRRAAEEERQRNITVAADNLNIAIQQTNRGDIRNAVAQVRSRQRELAALDADHEMLSRVDRQLITTLTQRIRQESDIDAAINMAAAALTALDNPSEIKRIHDGLITQRQQQLDQQRLAQLTATEQELARLTTNTRLLTSRDGRQRIERLLTEIETLSADDSARMQRAQTIYVDALIAASDELANANRFSNARSTLAAARSISPQYPALQRAESRVAAQQTAYQQTRAQQERSAAIIALEQRTRNEIKAGELSRAANALNEYRTLAGDTEFASTTAPRLLARAYQSVAQQRLNAGAFSDARSAVDAGLGYRPNDADLARLKTAVANAELSYRIDRWFAGDSTLNASNAEQLMGQFERGGGDIQAARSTWSRTALARLDQLDDNLSAHNQYLALVKRLLPDSTELARRTPLRPIPEPAPQIDPEPEPETELAQADDRPPPIQERTPEPVAQKELLLADVLGRWCAGQVEIRFDANRMTMTNGPQVRETYQVNQYILGTDALEVHWEVRGLGEMIMQFEGFGEVVGEMTQKRGRLANRGRWQDYNRKFSRCR